MRFRASTTLSVFLALSWLRSAAVAKESSSTVTVPPDFAAWAAQGNFGYSEEEIRRYFASPPEWSIDESGMEKSWIKPPPPPGVHPRVLFNPEDLPSLRQRLSETSAGREVMQAIRDHLKKELKEDYDRLADGTAKDTINNSLAYSLMYEAFRCLVDDDATGGTKVAAALTTFSRIVATDVEKARARAKSGPLDLTDTASRSPRYDGRTVAQDATREYSLGLAYDFAHPFMTEAQREAVRSVLAKATAGLTILGGESLPARQVGASYWNVWTARALFALAAIEGEEGYDAAAFDRVARSVTRYVEALFPSGDSFEAWGKNFLSLELMVLLAKRRPQENPAAHKSVRAVFQDYLPAALLPWGGGFTFADSWGKTGALLNRTSDAMIYHALFPRDLSGDWILRQQLRGKSENLRGVLNTRHFLAVYDGLLCAIFAIDFQTTPDASQQVNAGRELSWFCEDSGNLITRSAWDPKALYLAYQNRGVGGGHPVADRSHFSLYSHGRVWGGYQFTRDVPEQAGPELRSVVLADGEGPSVAEGRCVEHREEAGLSLVATDLRDAWNFQSNRMIKAPAGTPLETKTRSYNDLRLRPSPLPWMNLPIGQLPDWYTSRKPSPDNAGSGAHRPDWYRRHDVRQAFRTAALVRGSRPYVLIVDDLQLDDQPHDYVWGMTVPADVTFLQKRLLSDSAGANEAEILLGETDKVESPSQPSARPRRLYMRVLSSSPLSGEGIDITTHPIPNGTQPPMAVRRLEIPARGNDARFKVLLYPHEEGDPLPELKWNAGHSQITLEWPDQSQAWKFSTTPDERTRLLPVTP